MNNDVYDIDELINILTNIRDGKEQGLNIPKAFYTLCLSIKEIHKLLTLQGDKKV